jgi:hypothetical protein
MEGSKVSNGIQKKARLGDQLRMRDVEIDRITSSLDLPRIRKTMPLAPHQQRVVAEQAELAERLTKLCAFTVSEPFDALGKAERKRLRRQVIAMELYDAVLLERIEAFGRTA